MSGPAARPGVPTSVHVVAWIQIVGGAFSISSGLAFVAAGLVDDRIPSRWRLVFDPTGLISGMLRYAVPLGLITLILGALSLWVGLGLRRGSRLHWQAAIGLVVVNSVFGMIVSGWITTAGFDERWLDLAGLDERFAGIMLVASLGTQILLQALVTGVYLWILLRRPTREAFAETVEAPGH